MSSKSSDQLHEHPDFMLKEYERLFTEATNEVDHAERRVDFFLTIASGAIGVIVILSQVSNIPSDVLSTATQGVLIVLLFFGLTIQNRLNMRNVQDQANAKLLSKLQDYFGKRDPEVAAYLDYQRRTLQRPRHRSRVVPIIINRFRGSLTDLMGLSNGLLCGGIVLVALARAGYSLSVIVVGTAATILVSMIILFAIVRYARQFLSP